MSDYAKDLLSQMTPDVTDYVYNLMKSYEELEQENKRLNAIINNIHNYIEKMSYCDIVDNPKKDLSRILEKGE